MRVKVDVYQMESGVIVDSYLIDTNIPPSIDSILNRGIIPSAKKTRSSFYSVDKDRVMSPQGIFTLYTHRLNEHFGQQVNWEGTRGVVHVTEMASFCYKHIESLYGIEDRLIHKIIPSKGHTVDEVFDAITQVLNMKDDYNELLNESIRYFQELCGSDEITTEIYDGIPPETFERASALANKFRNIPKIDLRNHK